MRKIKADKKVDYYTECGTDGLRKSGRLVKVCEMGKSEGLSKSYASRKPGGHNRLIALIRLDIHEGILKKFYKYITIMIITVLVSVMYIYTYNNIVSDGMISVRSFSFADIWIYLFRGKVINITGRGYELPSVVYLSVQFVIAFIIGNYAEKDLNGMAKNIIVSSQSRLLWIISKIVWMVITVTAVYVVMAAIIVIACVLHPDGNICLTVNTELAEVITGITFSEEITRKCIRELIFVSYMASLELGSIQLAVMIMFNAQIAYMADVIIVVLSAYIHSPMLCGNAFMYAAMTLVKGGGVSSLWLFLISALVMLSQIIIMAVYFIRKDI